MKNYKTTLMTDLSGDEESGGPGESLEEGEGLNELLVKRGNVLGRLLSDRVNVGGIGVVVVADSVEAVLVQTLDVPL